MPRQTKLTEKDMSVLREGASTRDTFERPRQVLRDYSLKYRAVVEWDLNEEAERDRIFKLSISGENITGTVDLLIDAEELMRSIRWV